MEEEDPPNWPDFADYFVDNDDSPNNFNQDAFTVHHNPELSPGGLELNPIVHRNVSHPSGTSTALPNPA